VNKKKRGWPPTPGALIWKKHFTFMSSKALSECRNVLRRVDGGKLGWFTVSTYVDDAALPDGMVGFSIETHHGYTKGWLIGTIEQHDSVIVVNATTGVDPDIIFIIIPALIIFPGLCLFNAQSVKALLFISAIAGLVLLGLVLSITLTKSGLAKALIAELKE
jgi:hypothetical protein